MFRWKEGVAASDQKQELDEYGGEVSPNDQVASGNLDFFFLQKDHTYSTLND